MEELARDLFFQEYTPKLGDTVIDVGAGVGEEVNLLSRLVGQGRVYSIEAHPETFRTLVRRCEEQGLTNVTAVNVAVSDQSGVVLVTDEENYIFNRLTDQGEGHPVRAVTLDEFIAEHGIDRVGFLKMNIEGAEVRALLGMKSSTPIVDNLAVACHDFLAHRGGDSYRTKEGVRRLLLEYGYSIAERWRWDLRPWARHYLYARRLPHQGADGGERTAMGAGKAGLRGP